MVAKLGNTTGLTIGRANDVHSCVRKYYEGETTNFSMKWAILHFDNKSGAFAAPDDSGAIVANNRGCIITSGAGWTTGKDITTHEHQLRNGRLQIKFPSSQLRSFPFRAGLVVDGFALFS